MKHLWRCLGKKSLIDYVVADGLKPPSAKRERINVELQKENEKLRNELEEDNESMEALRTENKEMALRAKILEIFK
ncbi:hypothetical protein ACS0TY_034003 [Phlomoides rotata]